MPVQEHKVYTLSEIDMNLEFLSNILKYSEGIKKLECLSEIDEWLDKRVKLTELEKSVAS